MATHDINVTGSIDAAAKSTGGNESADSGKLAVYNTEGQIQGSSNSSSLAAVNGTASGSGYGVHGESSSGTGVVGQSTTGNGVDASSNQKQAVSAINFHATEPVVKAKNANAANTAPLAQFHRNNNQGLTIKNDGGLEWDSATGAATTRTGLGLQSAALQPTSAFDAAGSAAAAEAAAIAHADGLVSALGTAANADTGTGSGNVPTIADADGRYLRTVYSNLDILSIGYNATDYQWVNMPAALTLFNAQARYTKAVDLTGATQVNFKVYVASSAGSASAKLRLLYRTFASGIDSTPSNWSQLGSSQVQVGINSSLSFVETGYIDLVAGAKGSVLIGLFGLDGDGVADPVILGASMDIKFSL